MRLWLFIVAKSVSHKYCGGFPLKSLVPVAPGNWHSSWRNLWKGLRIDKALINFIGIFFPYELVSRILSINGSRVTWFFWWGRGGPRKKHQVVLAVGIITLRPSPWTLHFSPQERTDVFSEFLRNVEAERVARLGALNVARLQRLGGKLGISCHSSFRWESYDHTGSVK